VAQNLVSLRDAAVTLEVDPARLVRLGHYFHLAPGDTCLPAELIDRASAEGDAGARYRVVLKWLLNHPNPAQ
jgi:hypothetical protein